MMLRPGSALWLLRHEIRLFFFNTLASTSSAGKRGMNKRNVIAFGVIFLVVHGLAFAMLMGLGDMGDPPQPVVVIVTIAMAALMTMMMSTGLKNSVEVLFERGDLDLLLSSPLPSRSIFTVRLAAITVGIAALFLFFLSPFAHAGLVLGQFRWLGIYPGLLSMALVAASLSMLLTLALVRLLGVRRTRVVAQILGALSGALIFLASQSGQFKGAGGWVSTHIAPLMEAGGPLGPDSLIWLPGRGALGQPLPALFLLLTGIGAFFLTVALTHRFFVHGVQQAVSVVRVAKAPPGGLQLRFQRGLAATIIIKEWRLIARDPNLISQVLLQLLYLMPIVLLLASTENPSLAGIAASLSFLCASLTAALGWIIISAEDAPDLLRAAPCRPALIARAKLAAVVLPPLALLVLPLAWLALSRPLQALLMLVLFGAATVSAGLMVQWCGKPTSRSDFKKRGSTNLMGALFEMVVMIGWSGTSFLVLHATAGQAVSLPFLIGAGLAAGCTIALLALAYVLRVRTS